jgi:uncharacterized protein YbaA (DUF1428 family)
MATKRKVLKQFGTLELIECEGGGMLFYELTDENRKIKQDSDYLELLREFHNRINQPVNLDWLKQNY